MLRWRDRSKIDQSFDQACRTSVALLPYPREEQESAETGPLGSSRDLGESVDDSSLPLLNGHDRDKDSTEDEQGKIAPLGASQQEKRFWFQRDHTYDPDAIATQESVFDNPKTAKEYLPRSDWENVHRFDPDVRWTWREEHAIIRKIDRKIMVFACIMFMALELDRANIVQALTDNFLDDLKLTTSDYNLGNTIFKLSFLCAELPSQLISKWMGPDRYIPMQMVLWSAVASAQFGLSGRTSFLVCRSLLGILQGGFIPDVILYLSYFYKHHELSLRLGFFWTAMSMADVLAGFLAWAILHLRGVGGHAGWRYLFLIDGLGTFVIGLLAFGLMPASPTQTASWFRGRNGWFTEREEVIMVNRTLREDPSKGQMHNRQPITPALLWQSLKDYDLWPLYILGLTHGVPMTPVQQYLTLTLRNMGFDTFQSNLLAIPWNLLHMMTMLLITYFAEVFNILARSAVTSQLWALPCLIYLSIVEPTAQNRWTTWLAVTILLGNPDPHPIQVGWTSRNSNAVGSRTISAALYNMAVQGGGIISSNMYREDDAPSYRRGNARLLKICVFNIALYAATEMYYRWRNRVKARVWDGLSEAEQLRYLSDTRDAGSQRLEFRFVY